MLRYEYPEEIVPPGETTASYLRRLTEEGFARYFPPESTSEERRTKVRKQIEQELTIIAQAKYEPFFLTVYDIVKFARDEKILCQGRGSAANSSVCYCLGITAVDPSHMETLFARFISLERNEPPDIDVDFEHQRREEVIQYIYKKYSRDRAALTRDRHLLSPAIGAARRGQGARARSRAGGSPRQVDGLVGRRPGALAAGERIRLRSRVAGDEALVQAGRHAARNFRATCRSTPAVS